MPANAIEIGSDSTMQDVLAAFPGARRALFRRYHIGGCSSCGFQPSETLAQLCARNNNLDTAEVLAHIRTSHEQDLKLQITPSELAEALKGGEEIKLVDIRSRPEWNTTKLPGAQLLSQELMQEMLGRWPKETPVVVYDHAGGQGLDAVAYFAGHGMTRIRCLRGGIDAWSQEVDPSVPRYQVNRNTQ